jgi:hypothetical protein
MPTNDDPESRLDRVARDVSRTLLHGSRPTDNAGHNGPATMATGQQIRVDVPTAGDMTFEFSAGASDLQVVVPRDQAVRTDAFMSDAVVANPGTYLTLNVDREIPTWVFQQRQFSIANPPAADDTVSLAPLTAVKLPVAALREVQMASGESYVSFYSMTPEANVIARDTWQPAIVLRFPLKQTNASLPGDMKVYEIVGTLEGDRWFLDQLGLLPVGPNIEGASGIQSISLILENKDQSGAVHRTPSLTEWSIARTNLTRESRAAQFMDFVAAAVPAGPTFPYVVLSGDPGQNEDAISLLEMASITNSGGYFLGATTDWSDAQTLILTVVLEPKADPDSNNLESARLPLAANAIVLGGKIPDTVRFNGLAHIEVAPYTPPGTVSFGWTRTVPQPLTTDQDRFGFGTISIVDYSAADGSGQPVPLRDAVPVISPLKNLPGDHFEELLPSGALAATVQAKTSAMRLLAPHHLPPAAAAGVAAPTATQYFRASLLCYDKDNETESPWQRLKDPKLRQILLTPGFRDVFGNRFHPFSGPVFTCRMFYTDSMVSPSDWPGVRFAVYPGVLGGSPSLSIEMSYDPTGGDDSRKKRLIQIHHQLNGADNDVTVSFLADPLVSTHATLDVKKIANQLFVWASGDISNLVLPLKTMVCDGQVGEPVRFEPKLAVARTKSEYLPLKTDLPANEDLAAVILRQVTSVMAPINLQVDATPKPAAHTDPTPEEFLQISSQFQRILSAPLRLQVGFLRDQDNLHELWLIPNAVFPVVSADPAAQWSFATPCPLSNVLGNESFQVPNFGTTTTASPNWRNFPLNDVAVVDQDYDQLGRIALRMMETETADLATLMLRANADLMRSLLKTREAIANQLATYQGPGFLEPLFADSKPGDLDGNAVSRVAKDAFLADISSFYAVSTILQLPLAAAGSLKIQTFEGTVAATWVGSAPLPPPKFSDILLGGGDSKATILYDLPAGVTNASTIPVMDALKVAISHVQMPLPGSPSGPSLFNQGPWIKLAELFPLTWKGYPDYIPVAERVFPSKPVLQSTEALMPWMDVETRIVTPPAKIDANTAALLAQWGWKFSFKLIDAVDTDTVHVAVRYPQPAGPALHALALALDAGWAPVSLLNCLFALKLLRDSWDTIAAASTRLSALSDLAGFLSTFLAQGPKSSQTGAANPTAAGEISDLFLVTAKPQAIGKVAAPVMQNPEILHWDSVKNIDTVTVVARADGSGNTASLTGTRPVRSYKVSLTLLRNETFGTKSPRPGNKLLVYQCAPVESPVDCRPLNQWVPAPGTEAFQFDAAGQDLKTALSSFFDGLLQRADLSNLSVEAGLFLVWQKGQMKAVTPFAILPADQALAKPTSAPSSAAGSIADFLNGKCKTLLDPLVVPPDADQASIRLRVKITTPDKTPSDRRTLLEVVAIDFPLPKSTAAIQTAAIHAEAFKLMEKPSQASIMEEPPKQGSELRGAEFANALLDILRKIVDVSSSTTLVNAPMLFPRGIGLININTSIEPQKISLSLKISDTSVQGIEPSPRFTDRLTAIAPSVADDIMSYCVSLDTSGDPVMTDCNAFVKKVGAHFGITIPDLNADGIVDSFSAAPFSKTTMDPAIAMSWAKDGLVLAGMKIAELNPAYGTQYHNGHVAIVHPTEDSNHPGFPMASWGTLGGRGHANRSIRQSFPAAACDDGAVHFAFASGS